MKRKPQSAHESEQDFTWEELEWPIDDSKNNKAAGEDDIPYEFKLISDLTPRNSFYIYTITAG